MCAQNKSTVLVGALVLALAGVAMSADNPVILGECETCKELVDQVRHMVSAIHPQAKQMCGMLGDEHKITVCKKMVDGGLRVLTERTNGQICKMLRLCEKANTGGVVEMMTAAPKKTNNLADSEAHSSSYSGNTHHMCDTCQDYVNEAKASRRFERLKSDLRHMCESGRTNIRTQRCLNNIDSAVNRINRMTPFDVCKQVHLCDNDWASA